MKPGDRIVAKWAFSTCRGHIYEVLSVVPVEWDDSGYGLGVQCLVCRTTFAGPISSSIWRLATPSDVEACVRSLRQQIANCQNAIDTLSGVEALVE